MKCGKPSQGTNQFHDAIVDCVEIYLDNWYQQHSELGAWAYLGIPHHPPRELRIHFYDAGYIGFRHLGEDAVNLHEWMHETDTMLAEQHAGAS